MAVGGGLSDMSVRDVSGIAHAIYDSALVAARRFHRAQVTSGDARPWCAFPRKPAMLVIVMTRHCHQTSSASWRG